MFASSYEKEVDLESKIGSIAQSIFCVYFKALIFILYI